MNNTTKGRLVCFRVFGYGELDNAAKSIAKKYYAVGLYDEKIIAKFFASNNYEFFSDGQRLEFTQRAELKGVA